MHFQMATMTPEMMFRLQVALVFADEELKRQQAQNQANQNVPVSQAVQNESIPTKGSKPGKPYDDKPPQRGGKPPQRGGKPPQRGGNYFRGGRPPQRGGNHSHGGRSQHGNVIPLNDTNTVIAFLTAARVKIEDDYVKLWKDGEQVNVKITDIATVSFSRTIFGTRGKPVILYFTTQKESLQKQRGNTDRSKPKKQNDQDQKQTEPVSE